jgi:hypothetical protein
MFENKTEEEIVSIAGRSGEENSVPVEMTRRLKESVEKLNKSIEKLDKTTTRYSKVLVWLTLMLVSIGIFGIILQKITSAPNWLWYSVFGVMVVVLIWGTNYFFKK